MTHRIADRIKETTTSTGTGNLTLAGAVSKYKTVASALTADGDTGIFACVHRTADEWEVFLGTRLSATSLARTQVLSSSTGSAVNFSAGAKDVFLTPASTLIYDSPYQLVKGPDLPDQAAWAPTIGTTGRYILPKLSQNSVLTLLALTAGDVGRVLCVERWDNSGFTYEIKDDASSTTLITLPASERRAADFLWDGSNWFLAGWAPLALPS